MNTLREALQAYLDLRRGPGYKMHDAGLLLPGHSGQAIHAHAGAIPEQAGSRCVVGGAGPAKLVGSS